jgi:hypothetical protein
VLTLAWVQSKTVLSKEQVRFLNSAEYVGALSDFTGEIGRLAVTAAGKRDFEAVQEVYQVDLVVCDALSRMSGNRFAKKVEMVQGNTRKVGDLIYELRLLQWSGRAIKPSSSSAMAGASGASGTGAGDDEKD